MCRAAVGALASGAPRALLEVRDQGTLLLQVAAHVVPVRHAASNNSPCSTIDQIARGMLYTLWHYHTNFRR